MIDQGTLLNYVGGHWERAGVSDNAPIHNPATGAVIAEAPLSDAATVAKAVATANEAYQKWRRVPPGDRIQPLFKLKSLLEQHWDEVAQVITEECGKTLGESKGELQRGLENVEVATGIPSLMHGPPARGHRLGHRRADDPPARRRRGRDHAVQFPGDDPVVVHAVRRGVRQRDHPEAVRADADDDGPHHAARGSGRLPARRREPGPWRQGRRGCAAGSPGRACHLVRGFDPGGQVRLQPRGRQRKTRAGAGWGQEPHRRSCPTPTWR